MQVKENLNSMVIFKDKWGDTLSSEYIDKLSVDGEVYKYRLYYKTIWNTTKESKLLSFIMLNPSSANQYSNDPTINNCIKIAKKYHYDGMEVVNIYSLRHPVFEKIKPLLKLEGNPPDINYDFAQLKDVVLAWGNKKIVSTQNEKLFKELKNSENLYILGVENLKKIKAGYKYVFNQIRHPDNRAWSKLGGINNAKLITIDKNEFCNGKIVRE